MEMFGRDGYERRRLVDDMIRPFHRLAPNNSMRVQEVM